MNADEQDTRYVKPSAKTPPKKADHEHEYIRVVTWMHYRRFDGSVSAEKHKFSLPVECLTCGHKRRRPTEAVEVEVDPAEFKRMKDEMK